MHQRHEAPSYVSHKAEQRSASVSLLVSDWCCCHFYTRHPCCVNSKCNCPHLKMRCSLAHWWRIAIFRHQKVTAPLTNRWSCYDPSLCSPVSCSILKMLRSCLAVQFLFPVFFGSFPHLSLSLFTPHRDGHYSIFFTENRNNCDCLICQDAIALF